MKWITLSVLLLLSACSASLSKKPLTAPEQNTYIDIYNKKALKIINPTAKLEILAEGHAWTEGPVWVDQGYLLYSDIPNNLINTYTPGQKSQLYLKPSGGTGLNKGDDKSGSNGLLLDKNGKLILFQQGDRRVARMETDIHKPSPVFTTLASHYNGKRLNSPNDGILSSDNTLYFTDPSYGLAKGEEDPRRELDFNGIYALTPNGDLSLLDDSVTKPNGIGLSQDEKTLFVAVSDKNSPVWLAYDIKSPGVVDNKRIFFDSRQIKYRAPGMPDGMVLHSSGNLFATGPGGAWLFSENGELLAIIKTGRLTANCTLDEKENYLYLTAHDTLMRIKLSP